MTEVGTRDSRTSYLGTISGTPTMTDSPTSSITTTTSPMYSYSPSRTFSNTSPQKNSMRSKITLIIRHFLRNITKRIQTNKGSSVTTLTVSITKGIIPGTLRRFLRNTFNHIKTLLNSSHSRTPNISLSLQEGTISLPVSEFIDGPETSTTV